MPLSLDGSTTQKRKYVLRTNQGQDMLGLDPDPLQEFVSGMLTILRSQEMAELGFNILNINYLLLDFKILEGDTQTKDPAALLLPHFPLACSLSSLSIYYQLVSRGG